MFQTEGVAQLMDRNQEQVVTWEGREGIVYAQTQSTKSAVHTDDDTEEDNLQPRTDTVSNTVSNMRKTMMKED